MRQHADLLPDATRSQLASRQMAAPRRRGRPPKTALTMEE
jgi:hypothetical protein